MHFFICWEMPKNMVIRALETQYLVRFYVQVPVFVAISNPAHRRRSAFASVVIPSENEGSGFALKPGPDSRRWADVPLRHFIPQNDNPRFTIYGSCSSRLLKPCFCLYFAPYPTPTACRLGQSEACRHSPDKVPRCCNEGGALTRGVIQRGALSVVQIFLGLCLGLPKK